MKDRSINALSLLESIFAFLVILECRSVYVVSVSPIPTLLHLILLILIFILIISYGIKAYEANLSLTTLVVAIMFGLLYFSILMIFNYYNYPTQGLGTIIRVISLPLLFLVLGYFIVRLHRSVLVKLENLIVFIGAMSLFFWICFELGIQPNTFITIDWGNVHAVGGLAYLGFMAQGNTSFLGINLVRNTGIFAEAPMFSYILTIGFLINVFVERHTKLLNIKSLFLIFLIFTTTSTTGLIVVLLTLVYGFFFLGKKNGFMALKIVLFLCITPLVVWIINAIFQSKASDMSDSVLIRADDFNAGYLAWMQHPIFGSGMGNILGIEGFMNPNRFILNGNTGFSSGLFEVLAYGGIVYLLVFLLPVFLSLSKGTFLFGFTLFNFVLIIFTIVTQTYLFFLIMGVIWGYILVPNNSLKQHHNFKVNLSKGGV